MGVNAAAPAVCCPGNGEQLQGWKQVELSSQGLGHRILQGSGFHLRTWHPCFSRSQELRSLQLQEPVPIVPPLVLDTFAGTNGGSLALVLWGCC